MIVLQPPLLCEGWGGRPLCLSGDSTGFKSGIDKSTEWSTIPAWPSLMCFFNRGNTEEANSSKLLRLMFAYVLFFVGLCRD